MRLRFLVKGDICFFQMWTQQKVYRQFLFLLLKLCSEEKRSTLRLSTVSRIVNNGQLHKKKNVYFRFSLLCVPLIPRQLSFIYDSVILYSGEKSLCHMSSLIFKTMTYGSDPHIKMIARVLELMKKNENCRQSSDFGSLSLRVQEQRLARDGSQLPLRKGLLCTDPSFYILTHAQTSERFVDEERYQKRGRSKAEKTVWVGKMNPSKFD